MKNIVLIGMRGSGKTTIAKILAEKLSREWIDLDVSLINRINMTIPAIVEKHGWNWFRDRESEEVSLAAQRSGIIIATGGGVVERRENMEALRQNGTVFYLRASSATLISRIGNDPNRPSLAPGLNQAEETRAVLDRRDHLYRRWANFVVVTDTLRRELTREQTAREILVKIGGVS